jgi:CelD/BcsL family acetyltransferase involved in cellulose biosynthesis
MVWSPVSTASVDGGVDRESSTRAKAVVLERASEPSASGARRITVEVATSSEQLSALKSEYDRLGAACGNTLPFALHEWHVAWWTHLAKTGGSVRDRLRVHLVRDDEGRCVAILPFVSTQRRLGVLTTESLGFLGADPNFTEVRSPLVAPGTEALVTDAVARRLAADGAWDWILWSGVQGRFGEALASRAPLGPDAPVLDYVVDLPPTWDEFRSGLKRNIRESLRHCYNSLKRDGLGFEFEVAQTPSAVRAALRTFLSLHGMRAELTGTVAHPNRFAGDLSQRFLYDVCDRLALRGVARVFLLKIRGAVVAVRIGFVVGNQLYLYYSGFDPCWARYSVPTTLIAEAMKYAIGQGLTAANLSTGTDVSKTRWGARLVSFQNAVQIRSGARPHLTYSVYRKLFAARPTGWLNRLRQRLPMRKWS